MEETRTLSYVADAWQMFIVQCRGPSAVISADAELFAPLSCLVVCILIILNELATMNKRHGEGQDVAYYRYVLMNKRHG